MRQVLRAIAAAILFHSIVAGATPAVVYMSGSNRMSSKEATCQAMVQGFIQMYGPSYEWSNGRFYAWNIQCAMHSVFADPDVRGGQQAYCDTSQGADIPTQWTFDTSREMCVCTGSNVSLNGSSTCVPATSCPLAINGVCQGGKNNGPSCPKCGNPVNPANGNKFERETLYRGANGFELTLSFNTQDDDVAHFGARWRDSFERRIYTFGTSAVAYRPDGKGLRFDASGSDWIADAGTNDRLTALHDAGGALTGWQLAVAEGDELETYDAAGNLLAIRSRAGLVQTLAYSDGTTGANGSVYLDAAGQPTTQPIPAGWLIRATDAFGRSLVFAYDSTARIAKITDPAGGVYRLGYDINRNLVSIGYPDGKTRTFQYNEAANTAGAFLNHALTGITDENGDRYATFKYDASGRAVSTEHTGGTQRYTMTYNADGSTTVTDPLGTARTYGFQSVLNVFKNGGITGPACPACGPSAQTFDANGNPASRTDWNGNVTTYAYDTARNLETSRTEASGTPQARTIGTQWHATLRVAARIAEPLRITTYVYNGDGGASCGFQADGVTPVPGVLCSKTVQTTTDASGAAGFGATLAGLPRTWAYTYNANGSVLTIDGPRTDVADVTTYTYYANDDPDPGKRGNVATVGDALGHVTSITAYNAHGRPLTIVDPNGLATTLAYDARQRLVSRSVGAELTTYDYDGAGQLVKVTLPDGSSLAYGYDAAHRLTGLSDSLGNRVAYTLDAMGNRTQEQVFDPAHTLAQTRSRVYDGLNRLFQEIGAAGQTTQYAYDNQGNVVSIDGPLPGAADVTVNAYDALNRLKQVIDPASGVTQYGYNGIDQLVSVTDPRSLATTYSYDGLGNLNAQQSPDTGATSSTYDAAGNLLVQTDAKGQATTYAYDALNRVASIAFADGAHHAYTYDQGANAIGRLTRIVETDANGLVTGQTAYAYDAHGRVTSDTRTIAGVDYVTAYRYDAAGRLSGMTYPSGRQIEYGLDALGRVAQVSIVPAGGAAQLVALNVVYQPFGGVKGYTLGNGQAVARGYDQDGRIASYSLLGQTFAIGYDPAGRISFIADAANPANANNYGYDALDRLTSAVIPNNTYAYAYDAVGNRTSRTVGSSTDSYAYGSASNRIASITAQSGATRAFVFDANGSTTSDGLNQYAYDARGRMVQSIGALGTTTYQVNALGQRVRKTSAADDRAFVYDLKGRLISERTAQATRDYIYLGDIPVAVVQ
jgi:YD repeat-containing protein